MLLEGAGISRDMPRIVAGGARDSAFATFVRLRKSQDRPMLLVDSEEPVSSDCDRWRHVRDRDGWEKPADCDPEDLQFMVTCMEAWVASDVEGLTATFGSCLNVNPLPEPANAETTPRSDLLSRLERATRECKTPYKKGGRSFDALANVSASRARRVSRSMDAFLTAIAGRH